MNLNRFNQEEIKKILKEAVQLINNGTITGMNLITSNDELPSSSVILHFLHDEIKHMELIEAGIDDFEEIEEFEHFRIPRNTYYKIEKSYILKPNFKQEYIHAEFIDLNGEVISIEELIKNPQVTIAKNLELDLILPFDDLTYLNEIVSSIRKSDCESKYKWIHPVIIIKSDGDIELIKDFYKMNFLNIPRKKEEFYSVLDDESLSYVKEYLTRCTHCLNSEVRFSNCQINPKFEKYLRDMKI